ncbi:hypothetical protein [Pedobacter gandavensis]|uniref:Uncharacterized protein n=1 Tax=Pedobacter gandavensis TaxID=2679963 RepID=A0ABR6F1W8_9SPHI|nr:hypothetical protein [Pedobacter gandavensis]MBB2151492.1 hypothetical protein [Pedobacter gandavensis]
MEAQEFVDIDELDFNRSMARWVKKNPHIMRAMNGHHLLILLANGNLRINLNQFSPAYQFKFIDHNFEHYCLKFIDRLDEPIASYLSTWGIPQCGLHFIFLLKGRSFQKYITYQV